MITMASNTSDVLTITTLVGIIPTMTLSSLPPDGLAYVTGKNMRTMQSGKPPPLNPNALVLTLVLDLPSEHRDWHIATSEKLLIRRTENVKSAAQLEWKSRNIKPVRQRQQVSGRRKLL